MSRLVRFCLASALSLAGGGGLAHAYDLRVDPNAASRTEITFTFPQKAVQVLHAGADTMPVPDKPNLPEEYASAMTWYRVALADGYAQPPMVASPWTREALPAPLHWTWAADTGDLITRVDKGVFRLSLANNSSNWFQDVDCRLLSWPEGDSLAPMACDDGKQRTMQIPGDGVVIVDDVMFIRVFDSEETTLPPEEAIAAEDAGLTPEESALMNVSVELPDKAPIPQAR
jgi:hypothetical protein